LQTIGKKNNPWEEKSIRTKFKGYVFGILRFYGEVEEEKNTQQNYTDSINYPILDPYLTQIFNQSQMYASLPYKETMRLILPDVVMCEI